MSVRRTTALAALTATSLIAAAAVAAPLAGATTSGAPAVAAPAVGAAPAASSTARWIVRLAPGADPSTLGVPGVSVIAVQRALGTAVVSADAAGADRLRALDGVAAVSADRSVAAKALVTTTSTTTTTAPVVTTSLAAVDRAVGATAAWKKGWTGSGVDVAVVDTGVAPVLALKDATKVVVGPDLSFESQNANLRNLDTHGHGTHISSIIAGREAAKATGPTYAADPAGHYGVAPDARLVSVKIADHLGVVDVSQMIAAIDWVVANKNSNGLNIRVLNISYGTESPQDPRVDPLSYAAEVAWRSGIVVVASAGNEGGYVAGLSNPAYNPWVLAVGASDTLGTDTRADDVVAPFSARQGGNWFQRGIDIVAPGVSISAAAVPGSMTADANPGCLTAGGHLRGSGTSQAAAVVSGAVADLLQARPTLTPNQVKALLIATADKLPNQAVAAQGNGELDLAEALIAPVPTTLQAPALGTGNGSLESARGDFHVTIGAALLRGELDVMGRNWVGLSAASRTSAKTIWGADGTFNLNPWMVGSGFTTDTTSVAGRTWGGRTWPARSWTGSMWAGYAWSGVTWGGRTWNGTGWSGGTWVDPVDSASYAETLWSGAGWKRR